MKNLNEILSKNSLPWNVDDLLVNDWLIDMSTEDNHEITEALKLIKNSDKHELNFNKIDFPLKKLGEKLEIIKENLQNGKGFFVLKGMSFEGLSDLEIKLIFIGINAHIGRILDQGQKRGLALVTNDGKFEKRTVSEIQIPYLAWHNDRADIVSLLCIQPAFEGGDLRLVSGKTIFDLIMKKDPLLLKELLNPFYYKNPANLEQEVYGVPIFSFCEESLAIRYHRHIMDWSQQFSDVPKYSKKQLEALSLFEEMLERQDIIAQVPLSSGDMLFVNNFSVFHSRTAYLDKLGSDTQRLLYRVLVAPDNSQPLDICFKPLFGNITAGALRGGSTLR